MSWTSASTWPKLMRPGAGGERRERTQLRCIRVATCFETGALPIGAWRALHWQGVGTLGSSRTEPTEHARQATNFVADARACRAPSLRANRHVSGGAVQNLTIVKIEQLVSELKHDDLEKLLTR